MEMKHQIKIDAYRNEVSTYKQKRLNIFLKLKGKGNR